MKYLVFLISLVLPTLILAQDEDGCFDWLPKCTMYGNPDFSKCSTDSIDHLMGALFDGKLKQFGVEDLKHLTIPKIAFNEGNPKSPVVLNAELTNAVITDMESIKILKNDVHNETLQFDTDILIPKMRIDGNYKATGRILIVQLNGGGDSWFEIGNIKCHLKCDAGLKTKKGVDYYDVKDCSIEYTFDKLKFYLNNLFNGRKDVEEQTNKYLNENSREVAEIIKPVIRETIEKVLTHYLRLCMNKIPSKCFVVDLKSVDYYKSIKKQ